MGHLASRKLHAMEIARYGTSEVVLARRRGRPPGKQHDANVNLRLPSPAIKALKVLARHSKIPLTHIIRAGVVEALNKSLMHMAALAQDSNATPRRRMAATESVRLLMIANRHLSPEGLRLARKAAIEAIG